MLSSDQVSLRTIYGSRFVTIHYVPILVELLQHRYDFFGRYLWMYPLPQKVKAHPLVGAEVKEFTEQPP